MEIDILDFIEKCRHLVKQALGQHAGEPAAGGLARMLPQCLFNQVPTLLDEVEDIDFHWTGSNSSASPF